MVARAYKNSQTIEDTGIYGEYQEKRGRYRLIELGRKYEEEYKRMDPRVLGLGTPKQVDKGWSDWATRLEKEVARVRRRITGFERRKMRAALSEWTKKLRTW